MSHLLFPWVNGLSFSTFQFKKSNDKDFSDHDPVSMSINVWGARGVKTVGSCKGWSNKQTKLFQSKMLFFASELTV